MRFESLVNTEGIQTRYSHSIPGRQFESLVNTEGIQTSAGARRRGVVFESLVNTEGIQTNNQKEMKERCLRVLLIRKEFKPS